MILKAQMLMFYYELIKILIFGNKQMFENNFNNKCMSIIIINRLMTDSHFHQNNLDR